MIPIVLSQLPTGISGRWRKPFRPSSRNRSRRQRTSLLEQDRGPRELGDRLGVGVGARRDPHAAAERCVVDRELDRAGGVREQSELRRPVEHRVVDVGAAPVPEQPVGLGEELVGARVGPVGHRLVVEQVADLIEPPAPGIAQQVNPGPVGEDDGWPVRSHRDSLPRRCSGAGR